MNKDDKKLKRYHLQEQNGKYLLFELEAEPFNFKGQDFTVMTHINHCSIENLAEMLEKYDYNSYLFNAEMDDPTVGMEGDTTIGELIQELKNE